MRLKNPFMLDEIYSSGFLREYLIPACAAKFTIISNLYVWKIFFKLFLFLKSHLIDLKLLNSTFFFNRSTLLFFNFIS